MSTQEQRIDVFNDTQNWINSDKNLSDAFDYAKKHTQVFYEDDYPRYDHRPLIPDQRVCVSPDRSFQAAMRLRGENKDAKIAVMNFANAFHAGGGVTKGSSAQEESLCRTSTLYPLLYRRTLRDSFYKHHYDLNTPKASDSLIYTEGVIICKTDEDLPQRMPKEKWVSVDVITVAAPDLRSKTNMYADLIGGGSMMNKAELFGYHVKRAIHILTCAAAMGADILVLGAFGCGAFENDPEVVAQAYRIALSVFPKVFSIVEFAVYCPPSGSVNYEVFKRVLGEEDALNDFFYYKDRPAQIPIRRERFDYLLNRYAPDDSQRWYMVSRPNHFLIYDNKTKCCVYDATYIEFEDIKDGNSIVAVISNIRINTYNLPKDVEDGREVVLLLRLLNEDL